MLPNKGNVLREFSNTKFPFKLVVFNLNSGLGLSSRIDLTEVSKKSAKLFINSSLLSKLGSFWLWVNSNLHSTLEYLEVVVLTEKCPSASINPENQALDYKGLVSRGL